MIHEIVKLLDHYFLDHIWISNQNHGSLTQVIPVYSVQYKHQLAIQFKEQTYPTVGPYFSIKCSWYLINV